MNSSSDIETKELARELLRKYRGVLDEGCLVIGLTGELGAGKTVFAKGIGEELEVTSTINSPSYTYVMEHRFETGKLIHIDLWRVEREVDFKALGINDLLSKGNVVLIEWPKSFIEQLSLPGADDYSIEYLPVEIVVNQELREIRVGELVSLK